MKKPFMTKKQYLQSFALSIAMLTLTFTIVYFQDNITVPCSDGTKEIYSKTELHLQQEICDNTNYYKYNDNRGLGAYFPNKEAVNRVISEQELFKLDLELYN